MELTTTAQLAYLAAAFGGIAFGAGVAWLSRFELGAGLGLLVPGCVAAWYGVQCLDAYRAYTRQATWSAVVVEVRDEAANADGSITHEVPQVRYRDGEGIEHIVAGPSASGWQPGHRLRMLVDGQRTDLRQRVADPRQLRGAAIAMMLFGTFPLSLGVWFTVGAVARAPDATLRAPGRQTATGRFAARERARLAYRNRMFVLSVFGALLWIYAGRGELLERFAVGFGLIAILLMLYGLWLVLARAGDWSTRSGFVVLGLNFGAFAVAAWLLSPAGGG